MMFKWMTSFFLKKYVRVLRKDPLARFTDLRGQAIDPSHISPGEWPKLYFTFNGQQFSGYVEFITMAFPYLLVQHFCVNGQQSKQGIGPAMARQLARVASERGIEKIIFWQTRPKGPHAKFFTKTMKMKKLVMASHANAQAYLWVIARRNENTRTISEFRKKTQLNWTMDQYLVQEKIRQAQAATGDVGQACNVLNEQSNLLRYVPSTKLERYARCADVAAITIKRDGFP
jgi:hypothetical protein